MSSRVVDDLVCVVVFVDYLHRHEPACRIGQRDRDLARVEIEHRSRVQHVAIDPDHQLVIDRAQLAEMEERAEGPLLHEVAEVQVGFGAGEVIGCYASGHTQRVSSVGRSSAESTANAQNTTAR